MPLCGLIFTQWRFIVLFYSFLEQICHISPQNNRQLRRWRSPCSCVGERCARRSTKLEFVSASTREGGLQEASTCLETGSWVVIYGTLPSKKENVIYLSNHQCTVDWIIADMLAIRQRALGHVRYVLKDGLKWLPLYGWYFSQHGGIYVKRSAKFSEEAMTNKLQQQIKSGAPIYLVIFPEGTRYNPDYPQVIAASQAYARKEGLPELRHVMSPRVKAMRIAINTLRCRLDAVYDITVVYEGAVKNNGQRETAPSMPEFLCRECPKIHIYFDRVNVKEIPEETIFMKRWLHERFEIKDKLLTDFYEADDEQKRHKFPGEGRHSQLSLMRTLPSLLFLCCLTVPMLATETGRKIYMKTWLYGTLIGWLWVNISP
ncbi:1-acyl-sn-glycerol-3-phosphate acyltransferase epsilon isoform X2 [Leucoraja erinacea]|uniref:1-acyl-sn-glycerol-3-phosphate acyltransferase epsilon isoform X2 n=1 Tax=Leucoraja erinaceus TaxID=7782 RepID=UPI002454800E|nr:1-acyl-sn-glycerol-3-phosphate acyltransferase epsilon isoform X2 [Leucoraja erinacea]